MSDDDEAEREIRASIAHHSREELVEEIIRLRYDCGEFYQVIGYLSAKAKLFGDPQTVKALDNAVAAAEGSPRPHDDLLPFTANIIDT